MKSEDFLTFQCTTVCDYEAKEPNDLSFSIGEVLTVTGIRDDGWWEARNSQNIRGLVPSTFLNVPDVIQTLVNNALESKEEKVNIELPNLQTNDKMDPVSNPKEENSALLSGYRQSSLSELESKGSFYSIGNFIIPKLHYAGLGFKDYSSSSLKSHVVPLQRKINLIAARQIPEPASMFNVKSRYVRMCLHDGNEILSNVHMVKAKWSESSPKLWTFNLKVTPKTPCVEDGGIFIRSDKCVPTLGILFELCIKYEASHAVGEMCAGWAFMKLLDDSGAPIISRTKILKVQDTEPFTPYVSQYSSAKSGFLKNIITEQKLPRIVVSICSPDRSFKQKMSHFPTTLIGPWCCVPIIALCRKVIGDNLIERYSSGSTDLIQSPLLASLPIIFSELDLVDVLRVYWISKMKTFNASEIRKENLKKKVFQDLFLETVFGIISNNSLPPYIFGDAIAENARKVEINRLLKYLSQQGTMALSNEVEFSPLSLSKLSRRLSS